MAEVLGVFKVIAPPLFALCLFMRKLRPKSIMLNSFYFSPPDGRRGSTLLTKAVV